MIENKHIRSFLRVLDLGSFSKAARSLNIAQPALSQHVRKLEEGLGVRLLERGARGAAPTPAGREFSQRAREIIALVDTAEHRFRADAAQIFGEVSVGLPGSVCPVLAPPLMLRAAERFPEVRLRIIELMSGDLAEMLREGRIDLAILFNVQDNDDHTSLPLVIERLNLIGARDGPLVASETFCASRLPDVSLAGTFLPHGLRLLLERWSSETEIPLRFDFEADAPTVLVRLAASGHCHAIVARAAVAHEIGASLLGAAEIIDPPIERVACLCASNRLPPGKARDAVFALMKDLVSELLQSHSWPGGRLA